MIEELKKEIECAAREDFYVSGMMEVCECLYH
jgi:hypothetical protein